MSHKTLTNSQKQKIKRYAVNDINKVNRSMEKQKGWFGFGRNFGKVGLDLLKFSGKVGLDLLKFSYKVGLDLNNIMYLCH